MKLLTVSGSRNRKGQTARAAAALAEGAAHAGCDTESVFLPELRLERCRQCEDDGWGLCRGGQQCIIEDDFASVVEKVRQADVVVFATPVYFSDLSESLRAFLDRLRRICIHGGKADRIQAKPVVGVCVAGGGGGGSVKCAASLESILQTCGFDVVDMVPVRRQNLAAKLEMLSAMGKWLAAKPGSS
jgi:multimeric flavodoxin WrbA